MNPYLTLVFASVLALPVSAQEASVPAAAVTDAPMEDTVADAPMDAGDGADAVAPEETVADAPEEAAPTLQVLNAAETSLDAFQWTHRPIVVFADTPADPRFKEQLELLLARPEELLERDVVIIVDTDPAARSAIRTKLRPRGFMMTLIGKDGGVKLRKPFPWDVREITRSIDKMPMRQQEIRDAKAAAAE